MKGNMDLTVRGPDSQTGSMFYHHDIVKCPHRGGLWDFRFCGFGQFLDRTRKLRFFGFGVFCGLRFLLCFINWLSVFGKNTSGFSDLVSDVVFRFSH